MKIIKCSLTACALTLLIFASASSVNTALSDEVTALDYETQVLLEKVNWSTVTEYEEPDRPPEPVYPPPKL